MSARILIVDDVAANIRLLEAKLAAEYYHVRTAADGFEALQAATEWQPDLILLDVMMPGMDGFEVCSKVKQSPATTHIPVVMVTALAEPMERRRGLQCGADDFLTKPVEYETLLARVRGLVRLKRVLDEWRARGETARALGLGVDLLDEPSLAEAQVLVVDDWDFGAEAVREALAREGIGSTRARDETEALELSATTAFDLIVISLSLTDDDPLRLSARLRAADKTHTTPMLLIAEPEQQPETLRAFEIGVNDWVLRPLDDAELQLRARNQIKRKLYQDRLRSDLGSALELALTDPMTGLYNQRYLMRHMRGLLDGPQAGEFAVLMIDVDHFKVINDRYGHSAGDVALQRIAETLRLRTRVFDSIARYGGEEFVVVMPGAAPQDALVAADRLRGAVERIVFEPTAGVTHQLTVSIGVASNHHPGEELGVVNISAEALMQAADRALYEAKNQGRNRVILAR